MKIETVIIISTAAGLVVAFIATAVRYIRKSTANPEPEQPEPATITAKIDTGRPRPPKVVRAPKRCAGYLTEGKDYPVTYTVECTNNSKGYAFYIPEDYGNKIQCFEKKCNHLNGGDWIIVEREGDGEKQPSVEQQLTEAEAKVKQLEAELILTQNTNNHYLELIEETETERNEARALANDLRKQLDRALVVIKDLEDVNGQLLAMVQGDDGKPEAKPLRLVTDLGENECIHCPTEREAEAICRLMHEAGLEWTDGCSYLKVICWSENKDKTCYIPKNGTYSSIDFHKYDGLIIHPASDFLPPEFYSEQPEEPTTTEPAIDWTKPVAFPKGYEIPKGTRVVYIAISSNVSRKGITIEKNQFPLVKWDQAYVSSHRNTSLAPLDPADHPLHPEFKGKKTKNK